MKVASLASAAAASLFLVVSASAQQGPGQMSAGHGGQMQMTSDLPEACRTAAAGNMAQGQGQSMPMADGMMQNMQGMMANMSEVQKAYMQAMMKMHPDMMTGIKPKDADVAFACGMIPHHQGAIDMARVVLQHGDNAEIKKTAEKVIQDQGKEIAELKDWLQKNASK